MSCCLLGVDYHVDGGCEFMSAQHLACNYVFGHRFRLPTLPPHLQNSARAIAVLQVRAEALHHVVAVTPPNT